MTERKFIFTKRRSKDNDNSDLLGSQCFQINPNVVEREIPTNGEEYLLKVMKERAKCATVTRCKLGVLTKLNKRRKTDITKVNLHLKIR